MPIPTLRCPVCGANLVRQHTAAVCSYCGAVDGDHAGEPLAPWRCPNGHYLCEACRTATAAELPKRMVGTLAQSDPYELANLILAHPAMRQEVYGPDHHGVPALALLVALRNAHLWNGSDARILAAARKGLDMPDGSCYLRGACGACVGAGAAVSSVFKLGITSDDRGLALQTVSTSLGRLARNGGIRCCKEAVYAAIDAAIETLLPVLPGVEAMRRDRVVCAFSSSMPDCKGKRCPYYPVEGDR